MVRALFGSLGEARSLLGDATPSGKTPQITSHALLVIKITQNSASNKFFPKLQRRQLHNPTVALASLHFTMAAQILLRYKLTCSQNSLALTMCADMIPGPHAPSLTAQRARGAASTAAPFFLGR